MTFFVCKMCGRSMKAKESPNFCYFDRSDTIENISDEDAVKMELFSQARERLIADGIEYEFPGDIKWHPFTGEPMEEQGFTLTEFQEAIMVEVRR